MQKTFIDNFNKIKPYAIDIHPNDGMAKTDFAFQFELLGDGHGVFYVEYKDGHITVEPYNYYDHSARIQASADVIIELLSGKITINDAIRFGDITIISNAADGVRKVFSYFDTYYNFQKSAVANSMNQSLNFNIKSTTPWDTLRLYIEHSNIDEESKHQLLANLVKFTSKELHILIVGGCGCGKSSTINALFNMEIAQVGYGVDAETQFVSAYKLDNLYLHDTPGIGESPSADKKHIENIKAALQEVDPEGNAVIDMVLVIVDASNRDMRSSFELINEVIIPNLQQKNRILIGLNRCDLALDGRGWIQKYNYPNEELLQRLKEKSDSVRRRIKEDTGIDVEPVFYSALHKYNVSKLLSYLVKGVPIKKRIFLAEKINKDPDNFLRDDTMTLVRKVCSQNKATKVQSSNSNTTVNSYPMSDELYSTFSLIQSSIDDIEDKIETIHADIKSDRKSSDTPKRNNAYINSSKNPKDTNTSTETEYELLQTNKTKYEKDFQDSMEEAFEAASAEINKGSKEKIKFSFIGMLGNIKHCAMAGAEAGKTIGKNVPLIGAAVGVAAGTVIGGVGGLLSSIFKREK